MTDKDEAGNLMKAWAEAQQDFWNKLVAGQAPANAPPGFPPAAGMPGGGDAAEITRKLMDYGEDYLGVSRQIWKLVESAGRAATGAESQEERLRREAAAMQQSFADGFARLFAQAKPGAGPEWPAFPAFGPARERQESHERLTAATVRYQRAAAASGEVLSKVSGAAVAALVRRVTAAQGAAPKLDSLRAVHDLWVESGEQAYAAAAHGAEFNAAQSEMNASMVELRAEQQRQMEDWARAFDLPTRTELNTLNQRLTELRRQVRALEQALAGKRDGQ